MKAKLILLLAAGLLVVAPALAQQAPPIPPAVPAPPPHDPLADALFPPELVMANQRAIGLDADQKTYLRQEIAEAQSRFITLQWDLQDAMETLHNLLTQEQVNEPQVLAQLDKVLDAERRIKRAQMTLMVRIKNKLTPEQQAHLRELRPRPPAPPRPPSPPEPRP
ncbi:MAG TPA: periplasmic heavy metal sensor [Candidatus Acidoferrales bacterium]|nr:periplasmic heavy metal sensor [Candidatus Acidoferrales bacterium]